MGPKLFGLKHRGISSFSNSVISWRHFSHCGRMYSGMGLSQSNLSLHICWSICFPLSVTGAMYPLGSYMEPTVDKMPCQVKSKTSRPEIFLVWICAFCSYIVVNRSWVDGPCRFNHLQRVSDMKLTFEWSPRTAYCNISLSGSPTGLTYTDNHSVIKSSVLIWNLTHTHTIRENCTVLCSFSVRADGMHCEQVLHFDLALQFAIWWLLLAAHPMHKHSWKKKSFLSLKGFLQKSLQSSNLCTAPQNRQMFTLAGPEWLGLLALESVSRLPRLTADVARDLPLFLSGLCLTV